MVLALNDLFPFLPPEGSWKEPDGNRKVFGWYWRAIAFFCPCLFRADKEKERIRKKRFTDRTDLSGDKV